MASRGESHTPATCFCQKGAASGKEGGDGEAGEIASQTQSPAGGLFGSGLGFRVFGFMVFGFGFSGLGFRDWSLGFGV